jgi:hypothetical protein
MTMPADRLFAILALVSLAACRGKVVDPPGADDGVGLVCGPTTPCPQPTDPHVSDCSGLWCIYPNGPPASPTAEGRCELWQTIPGEPCLLDFPLPEGGVDQGVCNAAELCVCVPVEIVSYGQPSYWQCGDGE